MAYLYLTIFLWNILVITTHVLPCSLHSLDVSMTYLTIISPVSLYGPSWPSDPHDRIPPTDLWPPRARGHLSPDPPEASDLFSIVSTIPRRHQWLTQMLRFFRKVSQSPSGLNALSPWASGRPPHLQGVSVVPGRCSQDGSLLWPPECGSHVESWQQGIVLYFSSRCSGLEQTNYQYSIPGTGLWLP